MSDHKVTTSVSQVDSGTLLVSLAVALVLLIAIAATSVVTQVHVVKPAPDVDSSSVEVHR